MCLVTRYRCESHFSNLLHSGFVQQYLRMPSIIFSLMLSPATKGFIGCIVKEKELGRRLGFLFLSFFFSLSLFFFFFFSFFPQETSE